MHGEGLAGEGRLLDHGPMERQHRGHALDLELGQRPAGTLERLGPGGAGDDELGHQGVEGARHGLALLIAGVDPDAGAGGGVPAGDGAGGGQESAPRVLGVDAELDGMAARPRIVVADLLSRGDPEHLPHQIDAGDLLGDRVLDLEPGVHLKEGDRAVLADKELTRPGADVTGLAQDRLGTRTEQGLLLGGEERRGRLLDELLVTAL